MVKARPMTTTGVIARTGLAGIAWYGWWQFNIVHGNALAVEALGVQGIRIFFLTKNVIFSEIFNLISQKRHFNI